MKSAGAAPHTTRGGVKKKKKAQVQYARAVTEDEFFDVMKYFAAEVGGWEAGREGGEVGWGQAGRQAGRRVGMMS